jgi:SAM-dependent methyltransferase
MSENDTRGDTGLPREYFEKLYDRATDPWSFETRWYEKRKRALTMASLSRAHYGSVLELGCSTGLLTAELAERTDAVTAIDISTEAVELARQRLAELGNVRVERGDVREDLPSGPFDLIVVSEVAYYLGRDELEALADALSARLGDDGEVLLCHWRWPVDDYPLSGDEAQTILIRGLALPRISCIEEDDLLIDVLSRDARSVAVREGMV